MDCMAWGVLKWNLVHLHEYLCAASPGLLQRAVDTPWTSRRASRSSPLAPGRTQRSPCHTQTSTTTSLPMPLPLCALASRPI